MSPRRARLLVAGAAVIGLAIAVPFWALPNVAGSAFVHVRAVVSPRLAQDGPLVAIGAAPAVRAGGLEISVELENSYPLPVVVGTGPISFQSAVYRRDGSGHLTRVWQLGTADPAGEEGSDSPAGGGPNSGAAVVPPGISRHAITGGTNEPALASIVGTDQGIGVYYVRVWAYGIGSPLVPMALDGAVAPSEPPTDLPTAAAT